MNIPMQMLEIRANEIEIERREARLRDNQARIAREGRRDGAPFAALRAAIGGILIATGVRVGGLTPGSMEPTPTASR
jgi:hypothetical protein